MVKRLRHRPLTAGSRVRIPMGSPLIKKQAPMVKRFLDPNPIQQSWIDGRSNVAKSKSLIW